MPYNKSRVWCKFLSYLLLVLIPNGRILLLTWSQFFVNVNWMFVIESCRECTNANITYLYTLSYSNHTACFFSLYDCLTLTNFRKPGCVNLSSLSINFDYIWHLRSTPIDVPLISFRPQHNPFFLHINLKST